MLRLWSWEGLPFRIVNSRYIPTNLDENPSLQQWTPIIPPSSCEVFWWMWSMTWRFTTAAAQWSVDSLCRGSLKHFLASFLGASVRWVMAPWCCDLQGMRYRRCQSYIFECAFLWTMTRDYTCYLSWDMLLASSEVIDSLWDLKEFVLCTKTYLLRSGKHAEVQFCLEV